MGLQDYIASIGMHRFDDPYWGRPEVMRMHRPVYLSDVEAKPSSDLLASASAGGHLLGLKLVFQSTVPTQACSSDH